MRHFGVKTHSDPSYIFSGGQDPQPPKIYAPDCAPIAVGFNCIFSTELPRAYIIDECHNLSSVVQTLIAADSWKRSADHVLQDAEKSSLALRNRATDVMVTTVIRSHFLRYGLLFPGCCTPTA